MSGSPKRKTATIGILVGLLLSALDGTLVATALPEILEQLKGYTLYFLPNAVFMLASTISMPVWGRLSDMYGRSTFHLFSVLILMGGSALCGLSHSMESLVASRAVQGLGAGGVMSLSFIMIADLYELEERARMQGAISAVWGLASLLGPLLGAWITRLWAWQGIFWINLPVGAASAVLVQTSWERREARGEARPDWAGALLLVLASAGVLSGFSLAGRAGWSHPLTLVSFGAGAAFVALLAAVERRLADPFIAYDLYRIRLFATGAATGVCAMICLFVAVMHVPLLVAGVMGESLQKGGYMLTCMMFPWMVCSGLTRTLLDRFSYRTLALAGMLFAAAAYVVLSGLDGASTLLPVILAMVSLGTGLGLTVAPLLIAAQNAVPKERLGAGTSLTQFTRSMGSFVGLAVLGSLLVAAFGGKEPEGLIRFHATHDEETLRTIVAPLAKGLRSVFVGAIAAAGLGALLALAIPKGRARDLKAGP